MTNFLNKHFDSGVFAGEIISSCLIVLLILIIKHHFKNKNLKLLITIFSFFSSILIGRGLSNMISQGAPVFGILPSAIISCFIFNEFNLLWSIIGAQLVGSIIGFFIYIPYNFLFKKEMVNEKNEKELNIFQLAYKETIAQVIYMMAILFIGYITLNNYSTTIDISSLFFSMLTLLGVGSLMFTFSNTEAFMISPFISFFTSNILLNIFLNYKDSFFNNKQALINFSTQTFISILATITIGFIFIGVKWW